MSRYYSYLNTAKQILSNYKGEKPFAFTLKEFFAQEKKYGSRDRKEIAQLCYSFFRAGLALKGMELEDAVVAAFFLCASTPSEFLETIRPEWNAKCSLPPKDKLKVLFIEEASLFPFREELSDKIDVDALEYSLLKQPNLFARIRPGHHKQVLGKLSDSGITYQLYGEDCLAFLNTTKLREVLQLDKEVVIQDKSSQEVAKLFSEIKGQFSIAPKTWDCCAASGGKSILAWDMLGKMNLTVSDIRGSILENLGKRFDAAGIYPYKSFVADLSGSSRNIKANEYDLLIADVPCSGSGTWARTPEQLYFFNTSKMNEYSSMQRKIVSHVWPSLKQGGYFLYITCSFFKKENEEQVKFICDQWNANLVRMEIFRGYEDKADTLFAALLQKPL